MTSTIQTRTRRNGEGSVRPYRTGYQARYYDRDGVRRSIYAATEQDALAQLAQLRVERDQGLPFADRHTTLRAWLSEYIDQRRSEGARANTITGYRVMARRLGADPIGARKLAELSPAHVRAAMLRFHDGGLSASSVRLHHRFLRSALRAAMREGHLGRNVADQGRLPKVERTVQLPEPSDLARITAAVMADDLAAFYLLGLRCGLRLGEAAALTWGDLDLAAGTFRVRGTLHADGRVGPPKTATSVRGPLYMPPDVLAALRELRAATFGPGVAPLPSFHVFAARPGGKPRATRTLQERWTTLQRQAGVRRTIRFHDLRHQAAHDLLARFPIQQVSKYLGHASIAITADLYGHQDASAIRFAPPAVESSSGR